MTDSTHDPLTAAIIRAGERLDREFQWTMTFDGSSGPPPLDGEFVNVLREELLPLVDASAYRASRIAALRAELAALESAS